MIYRRYNVNVDVLSWYVVVDIKMVVGVRKEKDVNILRRMKTTLVWLISR